MDIIRATKVEIDGTRIPANQIEIIPPQILFMRETDNSDFIARSYVSGLEELKPEINIKGFPGGVAGFMSFCSTTPTIVAWASYTTDDSCTPKVAKITMVLNILAGAMPIMKSGKVENQKLELGKVRSYLVEVDGNTIYDIVTGYGTDTPRLIINGEDYLSATAFV